MLISECAKISFISASLGALYIDAKALYFARVMIRMMARRDMNREFHDTGEISAGASGPRREYSQITYFPTRLVTPTARASASSRAVLKTNISMRAYDFPDEWRITMASHGPYFSQSICLLSHADIKFLCGFIY